MNLKDKLHKKKNTDIISPETETPAAPTPVPYTPAGDLPIAVKKKFVLNKKLKKPLLIAGIAVASVGLLWGGLTLLSSARRQAVNVYAVTDFYATDDWGSSSQSSGMVTTDKLQKIYLTDTQTVTKVYVAEGQTVRKGDKLLDYDTTLSALDLKRAEIEKERADINLTTLKKELEALADRKTRDVLEKERADLETKLEEALKKEREEQGGDGAAPVPSVDNVEAKDRLGTQEKPQYLRDTSCTCEKITELRDLSLEKTSITDKDDFYVVIYSHGVAGDTAIQGVILRSDGILSFFTPEEIPTAEDVPGTSDSVRKLKARIAEIDLLLADPLTPEDGQDALLQKKAKEQEISEAEVRVKLAELDYKEKKNEIEDGAVYAALDGTVKAVRSESDAYQNNQAIVEVSGGGGYYITGAISELELGNVHIGDTVQVNSWMTGTYAEGEIVALEDYPSDQQAWGGGNQNVSYYPMKVFVGEDANLQENDYVDITYQSAGSGDRWYLDNMFIRTENGKSYVFVQDENGRLAQRFITTGGSLWGSYTEICSGLTQEDYIAFPYGKDVVDGAKTKQATIEELYGW